MSTRKSWSSLVPLLSGLACGPLPPDLDPGAAAARQAIINGATCAPGEASAAVIVLADAQVNIYGAERRLRGPICTATLIAPDVLLAAAHCVHPYSLTMGMGTVTWARYYVSRVEDLSYMYEAEGAMPDLPDDVIEVAEWIGHPDFNLDDVSEDDIGRLGNWKDVGLLFLDRTLDAVPPAVVITAAEATQIVAGAPVEIAGWGRQLHLASASATLPPDAVGIKMCGQSFINQVGDYELQIGGDTSSTRKCHGDSGGPSFMSVDTPAGPAPRVVGVTSHSWDKTDCAKGGVDTRVDAWLGWIDQEMSARCADASRVWCEVPGLIPPPPSAPASGGGDAVDPPGDEPDRDALISVPPLGCTQQVTSPSCSAVLFVLLGASALRRRRPHDETLALSARQLGGSGRR